MLKCKYPTCQLCQDWCDNRKGKFTRDFGASKVDKTTKTNRTKKSKSTQRTSD